LREGLVSDVTAFIVRAIGAPEPEAYQRFPEQTLDQRQLSIAFERFGLPSRLRSGAVPVRRISGRHRKHVFSSAINHGASTHDGGTTMEANVSMNQPQSPSQARARTIGTTAARIVLGLIFTISGISGFLFLFMPAPPAPPGLAATFTDVFFRSHWVQFVDGCELVSGLLLLANRYVALALMTLMTLIAVIANMFWFHLSMQPLGLPAPLVLLALWIVVATRHRTVLLPLLAK
jgi:putative oxidoreductase